MNLNDIRLQLEILKVKRDAKANGISTLSSDPQNITSTTEVDEQIDKIITDIVDYLEELTESDESSKKTLKVLELLYALTLIGYAVYKVIAG